jgi:hypothetical protein
MTTDPGASHIEGSPFRRLLLERTPRVNMVERLLGCFAFLTIYLVTGVTGAIASLMAHPRSIGVGASGALFGITGALLAVVLWSGGQMRELLDDRPISVGLGRRRAECLSRRAGHLRPMRRAPTRGTRQPDPSWNT